LEWRREKAFAEVSINIQKMIRSFLTKKRFCWMKLIQQMKDGMVARVEETLTSAIDMSFELPPMADHI